MRFIKALGLALLVAIGLIVLVHPNPSSTRADDTEDSEIVLCKKAEEKLCPNLQVWGAGKRVEGEFFVLNFLGTLNMECGEGLLKGWVMQDMGTTLEWRIPTTKINCAPPCPTATIETPMAAKASVVAGDTYIMLLPLKIKLVCAEGAYTCVFSGDHEIEIAAANTTGQPKLHGENESMARVSGPADKCGATLSWDAVIRLNSPPLPIFFSLFELTTEQKGLQTEQEPHEEELVEEQAHEEELEA